MTRIDITPKASLALDNLASTAINTSLVSDTQDTDSLGSASKEWANLYIGDAGKIYLGLSQDGSIERSAANEMTLTATSGITTSDGLNVGGTLAVDADLAFTGPQAITTSSGALTLHPAAGEDVLIPDVHGLVIGHTAQITVGVSGGFQLLGTAAADSNPIFGRFSSTSGFGPYLRFTAARSDTIGGVTIVQDNDVISTIAAHPADGVDLDTLAASFAMEVDDSSPAAGDIGMAFVWNQMPGGGGAIRETMRISTTGDLTLAVGDVGVTGTRIKKGWFTDLESTNAIAADITGDSATCSGEAATVATITGLAPDTATTQATQGNITSLGTLTGLVISGDIDMADTKSIGIADNELITFSSDGKITMAGATLVLSWDMELGHPTDTTLSRVSAGVVAIEGVNIAKVTQQFYIGTTQVAINRGSGALTLAGLTLTTPNIGTPSAGVLSNCTALPAAQVATGTFAGALEAADHGAAATDQIVNVSYGTGAAPAANTTTIGSLYITYTA